MFLFRIFICYITRSFSFLFCCSYNIFSLYNCVDYSSFILFPFWDPCPASLPALHPRGWPWGLRHPRPLSWWLACSLVQQQEAWWRPWRDRREKCQDVFFPASSCMAAASVLDTRNTIPSPYPLSPGLGETASTLPAPWKAWHSLFISSLNPALNYIYMFWSCKSFHLNHLGMNCFVLEFALIQSFTPLFKESLGKIEWNSSECTNTFFFSYL